MNFEFSDDMQMLADQAERLFTEREALMKARSVHDGERTHDDALWDEMVALGWAGAGLPEEYGGSGFGPQAPCIISEKLGESLAAVPYSSSICQAAEAILRLGNESQKQEFLPKLASGEQVGAFWAAPLLRGGGQLPVARNGHLSAKDLLVADAMLADFLVLAASDETGATGFYRVDLTADGVTREACLTIDPSRNHGRVSMNNVAATLLGDAAPTLDQRKGLLARLMIMVAFEQLGVASASLKLARDFACERHAFGRPIGSFQGIKHKLARMFILIELARSNTAYGAWAVSINTPELAEIAAVARLSALRAAHYATRETLQTFGGMGMTWEADVHLYLKRAKLLAASHGADIIWSERIVSEIEARTA